MRVGHLAINKIYQLHSPRNHAILRPTKTCHRTGTHGSMYSDRMRNSLVHKVQRALTLHSQLQVCLKVTERAGTCLLQTKVQTVCVSLIVCQWRSR